MRQCIAIAAVMSLVATTLAMASIPPSYRILVVGTPEAKARSEALLGYMRGHEAFFRSEVTVSYRLFDECLTEDIFTECSRAAVNQMAEREARAPIVIWARVDGDRLVWNCTNTAVENEPAGPVELDLVAAIMGSGQSRIDNLRTALTCIQDAARVSS